MSTPSDKGRGETTDFELGAIHAAKNSEPRNVAVLTVVEGLEAGRTLRLEPGVTRLGRDPQCHLYLSDSGLSRVHARIELDERGNASVHDAGSTNGTFLNGERVVCERLSNNDYVQLGPITVVRFSFQSEVETSVLIKQYEQSIRDELTGAYNRRYFVNALSREIAYATRHGAFLSVALLDVDHFKQINDTLGHVAGDEVLKRLATAVVSTLRTEDLFARYGGEEFGIILRGLDSTHAYLSAERIRTFIEALRIDWEGERVPVTACLGAATLEPEQRMEPEALLRAADECLYAAKSGGRNRSIAATMP